MKTNIGCYSSGCIESVVGQCPGYPDDNRCGRFYCQTHSYEAKLCNDCTELLMEDILIEDYSNAAKSVKSRVTRKMIIPFIVFVGVILLGAYIVQSIYHTSDAYILVSCPGLIIGLPSLLIAKRIAEGSVVREIESEKPDFGSFYKIWKKERDKEQIKLVLGLGVAIAAEAIFGTVEQNHMRREIDAELRKRGL